MARGPHGVLETNPLPAGYHDEHEAFSVEWTDARLARIERLRLVSDPGFPLWDVSYCAGRLKDGTKVKVDLPFDQLPKKDMMGAILKHAKRDRVFARGLGVFGAISTLC